MAYISGREIIDLLTDFPAKDLSAHNLASIFRKLPPRLYSIASSLQTHSDEVHLTVGVVRYISHGRNRKGVCSSFLADDLSIGQTVDVFVSPNKHFKLPDDPNTPLIMVGPGTELLLFAPLSKKELRQKPLEKTGSSLVTNTIGTDFLYQTEQSYLKQGLLNKQMLHSQETRPDVQDRMLAAETSSTTGLAQAPTFVSVETRAAWQQMSIVLCTKL